MRNLALVWLWIGCGSSTSVPDAATADASTYDAASAPDAGPTLPRTIGPVDRPARFYAPSAHDGTTPLPAVVLLHGYGVDGSIQDIYFGMRRAAGDAGFYLVVPDGTLDVTGRRFWNATDWCCDTGGTEVDDVAYLTALVDALEAVVPVDPDALFFAGHSNGGFMSFRMACELSERVAGIMSLAGGDFLGDGDCVPSRPVSVLAIHGDLDETIAYGGAAGYPSADAVTRRWAARASCELASSSMGPSLDLDSSVTGSETEVLRYQTGCVGAQVDLWTIRGGAHIPPLTRDFSPTVLEWLRSHAR